MTDEIKPFEVALPPGLGCRHGPDRLCAQTAAGAHGWEAVYTLNRELYRSELFASEAQARADLATHQDALAAAGWTPVPFQP